MIRLASDQEEAYEDRLDERSGSAAGMAKRPCEQRRGGPGTGVSSNIEYSY
jgi:hypothetical protein